MADHSTIEWTDATWNPVTGCSVVSPGCTNCYAMKLAGTRLKHHWSRKGLTKDTKAGPVWTGEVRFNREWLTQPLGWKKPRMIFVCAHGDLFHPDVPDAWIDQVFAVMALCPQHTFQVLTKRPERMRDYLGASHRRMDIANEIAALELVSRATAWTYRADHFGITVPTELWPLPNVWLGTSVETEHWAQARIPHLLETPAAVRFISAEPSLIDRVRAGAGGTVALAAALSQIGPPIRPQAVSQWTRVPAERCLEVERLTGISRHLLRPDVFGPAPHVNEADGLREGDGVAA